MLVEDLFGGGGGTYRRIIDVEMRLAHSLAVIPLLIP